MNTAHTRSARHHYRSLPLVATLCLAGCSSSSDSSSGGGPTELTLLRLLELRGLTTLEQAVTAAGLDATLAAPGSLTLFAPTNAAFAALPAGELQRLLDPANVAELRALLEYHLADTRIETPTLKAIGSLMTREGSDLLIDLPGDVLFVNEARVGVSNVWATNGVLHEVNAVLRPPVSLLETLEARGFTILRELIDLASHAGALTGGNLTLAAPTDAAFQALPAGRLDYLRDPANVAELTDLLTFHVLPGRRPALELLLAGDTQNLGGDLLFASVEDHLVQINGERCPLFNIPATDGLLHIVDEVLTRTTPLTQVIADLGLTTLSDLIVLAGLDVALSAQGTFTVIAPSEAALAALPPGELASLLDPVNQAQRLEFLQRHLSLDALQQEEIARLDELPMLNGQLFVVNATAALTIGGIPVASGDHYATNGVLHVVDMVLPAL
ncbi:MAG: fasciclin domain-containing protein [Chthoniobacterales bacterium]|nr:fasciclin domain-containing protein [Chthoniobacterales bacterium]